MRDLAQDIRQALRMFRNNAGFTIVAILTLALGIGANTAIFSIVKAVVLRPLPFSQPHQLYDLWTNLPDFGRESASLPDFRDWRDQNTVFEDLAAYVGSAANLAGGTEPERVRMLNTTPNLFPILGLQPAAGRNLVPDDARPGAPKVAVLSYKFWQQKFGGRPDVLGQSVTLNTTSYTVVGVASPDLDLFDHAGVVIPLSLADPRFANIGRRNDFLNVVGRAKPGVTKTQIESQMRDIAARLDQQYPQTNKGIGIEVATLQNDLIGNMRPILLSLWASVAFMLLIVCVNMANLMLARSSAREKEMAIRAAMGARSSRLVRQLITEGVVLSLLGAGAGLLLAYWGMQGVLALAPKDLPFVSRIQIDGGVLAFAAGLAIVTGIVFSLLPAIQGSRAELNSVLKETGRSGSSARHSLRRALVICELALSLVLLTGAGLMIRTVQHLQRTAPGLDPDHVLSFRVSLPSGRYDEPKQIAFFDRLLSTLRTKPGVKSAGATSNLYLADGVPYLTFNLKDAPPLPPGQSIDAQVRTFSPSFLETLRIGIVRGRNFTDADNATAHKVAIVNQALIDRYFAGQELIGRSLTIDGTNFYEIVGVIGNVKQRGADQDVYPEIAVPEAQLPQSSMTMVLRTGIDPNSLISTARSTVAGMDSTLPVFSVQTMDEVLADSRSERNFQASILTAFAALALLLAAIGIYGVMTQTVVQRTAEFGVRMALGAQPWQVLRLVLAGGLRLAILGLAFGVIGALVLARFLHSFLFGVSAHDPVTLALVCALLAAVSLIACVVPARRAMKIDPMVALREE